MREVMQTPNWRALPQNHCPQILGVSVDEAMRMESPALLRRELVPRHAAAARQALTAEALSAQTL